MLNAILPGVISADPPHRGPAALSAGLPAAPLDYLVHSDSAPKRVCDMIWTPART